MVAPKAEEVVVHSLPLVHELLLHSRDGVSGEGGGHDPCGVVGAWVDGWAGLIGKVTGSEDGGHSGGHGWHGDGGCCEKHLDAGAAMMPVPCGVGIKRGLSTSLFLCGHNLHEEMSASEGTHHHESGFQEVTHT